MQVPTSQPAPVDQAAQATPAADPAPAQQVAPGAPPAATAATAAGATPAEAPADQAALSLASIAERIGLVSAATVDDILDRIETLTAPPPAPDQAPSSKKAGEQEIPPAIKAELEALKGKAIRADLMAAVGTHGWTDQQKAIAIEMLAPKVSFDAAAGEARGPRAMKLETMARDLAAKFPDIFKPPAPNVPGHKMAPPNNGVMPASSGVLQSFPNLKF